MALAASWPAAGPLPDSDMCPCIFSAIKLHSSLTVELCLHFNIAEFLAKLRFNKPEATHCSAGPSQAVRVCAESRHDHSCFPTITADSGRKLCSLAV